MRGDHLAGHRGDDAIVEELAGDRLVRMLDRHGVVRTIDAHAAELVRDLREHAARLRRVRRHRPKMCALLLQRLADRAAVWKVTPVEARLELREDERVE